MILGHSLHEYPGDFHQFWFYRMFQTVRMPLFVFISGYLFMISMVKREYNVSLVDFIKNKAQRLLVPYFVLTTCSMPDAKKQVTTEMVTPGQGSD